MMSRYDQNEAIFKRWQKQGRGQGTGKNYLPWLKVYNVPSRGRSHRARSSTTNRVVHLVSDLEFHVFLELDWATEVVDIREQFPLSLEKTIQIATEKGLKHPAVRGENIVMTSDFFVTQTNQSIPNFVIQAKYSDDVRKPRTKEKLLIEKSYWNELGVYYQVVTEKDINPVRCENLKWLHSLDSLHISIDSLIATAQFWEDELYERQQERLLSIVSCIDETLGLDDGTSLSQLRLLFSKRIAIFDLTIPFFKLVAGEISFVQSVDISNHKVDCSGFISN
ncbi:TnsA endonuclease N-terminal domain-containing protein [Ningiella sp. W23]|uniref:TnsA endonuclease N-terminal domain-containing protein n=1 Tax=Ningiella sp. W23 TaxID=3023715 RepID=UPI0037568208